MLSAWLPRARLSQNRKKEEREHIITAFEKSSDAMEKTVAGIIRKVNKDS
jgi:predicted FMN-binding regulatory protein PaiB